MAWWEQLLFSHSFICRNLWKATTTIGRFPWQSKICSVPLFRYNFLDFIIYVLQHACCWIQSQYTAVAGKCVRVTQIAGCVRHNETKRKIAWWKRKNDDNGKKCVCVTRRTSFRAVCTATAAVAVADAHALYEFCSYSVFLSLPITSLIQSVMLVVFFVLFLSLSPHFFLQFHEM